MAGSVLVYGGAGSQRNPRCVENIPSFSCQLRELRVLNVLKIHILSFTVSLNSSSSRSYIHMMRHRR